MILLIAAATLVLLACVSEGVARLMFRDSSTTTLKCLIMTDRSTGVRGIPGSSCQMKSLESPLVDYHFNACGFRTPQPCGPPPTGTYRIVLIGSSFAYGMHVAQADSMAAKLGPMLSQRTGMPVDIFNEGMQWGTPGALSQHIDDVLRMKPDMILWALTPLDAQNALSVLPFVSNEQPGYSLPSARKAADAAPVAAPKPALPVRAWRRFIGALSDTRTVFLLQHYLYRSQSQFLDHALAQGDAIDYLRVPTPPALQSGLDDFAMVSRRIADRAQAAHVPLVVTPLPLRAQAVMLTNSDWDHKRFDPSRLGRALRTIVEANGARYVDMTEGLASKPQAGQLYFSVDEHLPPQGHTMLAEQLSDALMRAHALPSRAAR